MASKLSQIGARIKVRSGGLEPAARAAGTANSTGVDRLAPSFGACVLLVQAGAASGTPTTLTLDAKVQHSDDNSTFTDYTPSSGTASVGQITAASTNARKAVDLSGAKRYVRVAVTTAFTGGTSPTLLSSAALILGDAQATPTVD